VEYLLDLAALQLERVVGTVDHAGVDIERIDLDVLVVLNEKQEAVHVVFFELFLGRLQVVLCGYRNKHLEDVDEVVTFDVANQVVGLRCDVDADLCNFATLDVVEVDEDGVGVHSELEVAPKRVEANGAPGDRVALMHDGVDEDPLVEIKDVESVADDGDILREQNHVVEFGDLLVFVLDGLVLRWLLDDEHLLA